MNQKLWGYLDLKSVSTFKVDFVCIACIIECHIFAPRKDKHPQINKHLFMYFYFTDFAFPKIKMQLTIPKSFNVLKNAI